MKDRSLVFFTLISQTSVGISFACAGTRLATATKDLNTRGLPPFLYLEIISFALIVIGLLSSTAHLGSPQRAYRAILNLRHSWLSREVFFGLLFATFSGMGILFQLTSLTFPSLLMVFQFSAVMSGGAFIYSMAWLYMLRTVPPWHNFLTLFSFLMTAGSLGVLFSSLFFALITVPRDTLLQTVTHPLARLSVLFIALQIITQEVGTFRITTPNPIQPGKPILSTPFPSQLSWRNFFSLSACVIASAAVLISSTILFSLLISLAFILALLAEIANRQAFYKAYERVGL